MHRQRCFITIFDLLANLRTYTSELVLVQNLKFIYKTKMCNLYLFAPRCISLISFSNAFHVRF